MFSRADNFLDLKVDVQSCGSLLVDFGLGEQFPHFDLFLVWLLGANSILTSDNTAEHFRLSSSSSLFDCGEGALALIGRSSRQGMWNSRDPMYP
jgi:hypothetical protein